MAVPQLKEPFTAQDYFAWEQDQVDRHEYLHGETFAMAGASENHNVISLNVAMSLRQHLRGTPCRVYIADMRLELVRDEHYCYPDVFVTCDPRDKTDKANYAKQHPAFIIEILSPSTAQYDKGQKLNSYKAIESVQAILLIDPEARVAIMHSRPDSSLWTNSDYQIGDVLEIPLGFSVPLADFFIDML